MKPKPSAGGGARRSAPKSGREKPAAGPPSPTFETAAKALRALGIDLEQLVAGDGPRVKVVCVKPDLRASLDEMEGATRDQVVMVRIDEATSRALDGWVETGTLKSRSEAAAVFIREGLKVREKELAGLEQHLAEVEQARARLRKKAREVLGGGS